MNDQQTDKSIIRLSGVSKSFGPLAVLRRVDLEIEHGKTTAVIGPSGVGKSVMLKIIVGLMKPDEGKVWFDDQRVDLLNEAQLAHIRTSFGFLFQMGALFDSLTVRENICFPMIEHSTMNAAQRGQRCEQVLSLVGMSDTAKQMPAQLSGGQRKRVALARAIALHPRVILYDEPTTGLDPVRADEINELILKLQRELQVTSVVVTHDMTSAYKIADRIVMLYDGHFVADGDADQIRYHSDPLVQAFVQGESAQIEAVTKSSHSH